jgi:hypothetical protein
MKRKTHTKELEIKYKEATLHTLTHALTNSCECARHTVHKKAAEGT